jgi:colicin import membrane protein
MIAFIRENFSDLKISMAGHGLLLLGFSVNLLLMPAPSPQPLQLAIEATVIDVAEIRRKEEDVLQRQQAQEREKQQAADTRRKQQEADRRKKEQARIAEQRRKDEAVVERKKEQTRKEEQARVAEQKKRDAAERERVEVEQKRQAEEKRRQDAEQKRADEERRIRQAELAGELAAEEQRLAAISSGKLAEYLAMIGNRVERNWVQPASAKPGVECVVHVTQIPGGEVVNVRVGDCNGDAAVVRSIEAAVFSAAPLPLPSGPSLFDRNLRFTFKPEE